jgi:MoaA/NifB/PqqE/SkfB family radical SAM enzyme
MSASYAKPVEERPCQLRQLFIRHDGVAFPCCQVWGNEAMRIGHISEPDFMSKLFAYNKPCSCNGLKMRPLQEGEPRDFPCINIEFSLACNGGCAFCCVDAPSWRGTYELYDSLHRLVESTHPGVLWVQGGEVLIQRRTLDWLHMVKQEFPQTKQVVVTNGCSPVSLIEECEQLFEKMIVSIAAFEPVTYTAIMNLDMAKTLSFVETLLQRKKVKVILKYLLTPSSFHQLPAFLRWALARDPEGVWINEMGSFIEMMKIEQKGFWMTMLARTAVGTQKVLSVDSPATWRSVPLSVSPLVRQLTGLSDTFAAQNGLAKLETM